MHRFMLRLFTAGSVMGMVKIDYNIDAHEQIGVSVKWNTSREKQCFLSDITQITLGEKRVKTFG